MFAAYCQKPHSDDPMAGLVLGDRPDPKIPQGWVRVKVTHASLNRHDIFTLRGITSHAEGITYPMILGNDGAGALDDGTPVVIYPVMGSDDWRGDETLDPHWHIFSEFVQGTFADYVAMPKRNAIPVPEGISALNASVLGTAWLTAYRALFTRSRIQPGQTPLVQGASGGMSTALIQMAHAAGVETWVTSRSTEDRALAEKLGARRTFGLNARIHHDGDIVKKLIVFDLDGTLAGSKSPLDSEMSGLLHDLLMIVKVAVISGGDWPQFEKQLLSNLPHDERLANLSLLPTCGTKFYRYDSAAWKKIYSEDLTAEERDKILSSLTKAIISADFKTDKLRGEQIEDRGSQITFSALGQKAPLEEKNKW